MKFKRYEKIRAMLLVGALMIFVPLSSYAEAGTLQMPGALQILDRADDKWDLNLRNATTELELLVYRENELRKTYRMTNGAAPNGWPGLRLLALRPHSAPQSRPAFRSRRAPCRPPSRTSAGWTPHPRHCRCL